MSVDSGVDIAVESSAGIRLKTFRSTIYSWAYFMMPVRPRLDSVLATNFDRAFWASRIFASAWSFVDSNSSWCAFLQRAARKVYLLSEQIWQTSNEISMRFWVNWHVIVHVWCVFLSWCDRFNSWRFWDICVLLEVMYRYCWIFTIYIYDSVPFMRLVFNILPKDIFQTFR